MDNRDSIERLARVEMTAEHHDYRLTSLETEREEWRERLNELSIATARLVETSANLVEATRSQEIKINLLEKTKNKLIGWFAGASVAISAIWAVVVKFLS